MRKAKKKATKGRGKATFRLSKPLKEEPKRVRHEDKCRHIRDNRKGRAHLSLCGCEMHEEWGRKALDPLEELDFEAKDVFDYMAKVLRGCRMCLLIWIKRFL